MPSPGIATLGLGRSYLTPGSLRRPAAPCYSQNLKDVFAKRSPRAIAESDGQTNELPNFSRLHATTGEAAASAKFHAALDDALRRFEKRITTQYTSLQATVTSSFQDIVLVCSQLLQHRDAMTQQLTEVEALVKEALMQQHDMSSTPPVFLEKLSTSPLPQGDHTETKDTRQNMNVRSVFSSHLDKDGADTGGQLPTDMGAGTHQVSSKLIFQEVAALDVFPTGGARWNLDQLDRKTKNQLSQEGSDGVPFLQEVIAKARVQDEAFRLDPEEDPLSRMESAAVVEEASARESYESAEALSKPRACSGEGPSPDPEDADAPRQKKHSFMQPTTFEFEDQSVGSTRTGKKPRKRSITMRVKKTGSTNSALSIGRNSVESMFGGGAIARFMNIRASKEKLPLNMSKTNTGIDFDNAQTVSKYMFNIDVGASMSVEAALALVTDGPDRFVYKDDHWATKLIFSDRFIQLNLVVVFLNIMYIGTEAHFNAAGNSLYASHVAFMVASNLFCIFFVLDWWFHVAAYTNLKILLTRLYPFVDTVLVILTVLDTWLIEPLLYVCDVTPEISPLKVLGILSFARVARFVGAFPELLTLMRGIAIATRAVFWSLVMIAVFTYIFAVILVTLLQSEDAANTQMGPRNFRNLRNACMVLLYDAGLLEEFGTKMTILMLANTTRAALACITMMIYMFIINLTILNLLTGAMLEVVKALTSETQTQFAVTLMRRTILKQLFRFEDGNGHVSRDELQRVLDDEEAEDVLRSLNVDRVFLLEMQDLLFPNDESEVSITAFTEMMLLCRGDNAVTVQTMANGLLYISSLMYKMEKQIIEHICDIQVCLSSRIQYGSEDAMAPSRLISVSSRGSKPGDEVFV